MSWSSHLFVIVVAEWRLRGRGAVPPTAGLFHVRVSRNIALIQHCITLKLFKLFPSFFVTCVDLKKNDWFLRFAEVTPFSQQRLTNIKCPQISKTTATHPSIDYQARFPTSLFCVYHCGVALTRRGQNSICDWNIPSNNTGSWTKLKRVQIIQVSEKEKKRVSKSHTKKICQQILVNFLKFTFYLGMLFFGSSLSLASPPNR